MTNEPLALVAALLELAGAFLFLASAIGVWRLPDFASRVHAPTKAASLGITLLAGGLALHRLDPRWVLECALLVLFVFLTVPLGTQLLLRTAADLSDDEQAPPEEYPEA
jgi:multicomponent Na+:H+ antiporter subunit G